MQHCWYLFSCLSNIKNMLILLNIPLCDYRNEMLNDIPNIKCVRNRNEGTARSRVRAKSDENNFLP